MITDIQRRTTLILKNSDLYQYDEDYRKMVDNTVFLTIAQKEESARFVDDIYGVNYSLDYRLRERDE